MVLNKRLLMWSVVAILVLSVKICLWIALTGHLSRGSVPEELPGVPPEAELDLTLDIAASHVFSSVVYIEVLCNEERDDCDAVGTGFAIDERGTIATNYHVIAEAQEITVHLADGTSYTAAVLHTNEKLDIAIISIEAETYPPRFGNALKLSAAEEVGFLSRLGGEAVVVPGQVINESSYRDGQWFILTSAPALLGHSGSPLFNLRGEVVGMITYTILMRGNLMGSASVYISDVLLVAGR